MAASCQHPKNPTETELRGNGLAYLAEETASQEKFKLCPDLCSKLLSRSTERTAASGAERQGKGAVWQDQGSV